MQVKFWFFLSYLVTRCGHVVRDHVQCLGGSPRHCTSQHRPAPALHMLSFENFVKSMPPSLSELKVTPSFCFTFKIPDDVAASIKYLHYNGVIGIVDIYAPVALAHGTSKPDGLKCPREIHLNALPPLPGFLYLPTGLF